MGGTDLKEMEMGCLYYSLYTYRRKIESDIKRIIRSDNVMQVSLQSNKNKATSESLCALTQKLRNISIIIAKLITLKRLYK